MRKGFFSRKKGTNYLSCLHRKATPSCQQQPDFQGCVHRANKDDKLLLCVLDRKLGNTLLQRICKYCSEYALRDPRGSTFLETTCARTYVPNQELNRTEPNQRCNFCIWNNTFSFLFGGQVWLFMCNWAYFLIRLAVFCTYSRATSTCKYIHSVSRQEMMTGSLALQTNICCLVIPDLVFSFDSQLQVK